MKQASQKVKNNKLSRHGNTYLLEITNTNYGWREDRSVAGVELLVVDFFQSQSGLPPGGAPPRTLWSELPRGDPNQRSPDRSRKIWIFVLFSDRQKDTLALRVGRHSLLLQKVTAPP